MLTRTVILRGPLLRVVCDDCRAPGPATEARPRELAQLCGWSLRGKLDLCPACTTAQRSAEAEALVAGLEQLQVRIAVQLAACGHGLVAATRELGRALAAVSTPGARTPPRRQLPP